MFDAGEIRRGSTIELDGGLYRVLECNHIKIGRGSAQLRLKLRDIRAGHTIERTFQASEKFVRARLENRSVQYLYRDGDMHYFMDNESFEQTPLDAKLLGDALNYLTEDMTIELQMYKDEPMGVELPLNVELKVAETGPGFKGDTASAGSKPATLETGLIIQVPLFISSGDTIRVDTRTGQYLERTS